MLPPAIPQSQRKKARLRHNAESNPTPPVNRTNPLPGRANGRIYNALACGKRPVCDLPVVFA
jgi:hypothetical protein